MFDPARLFHCSFTHKLSVVPHRRAVPCRGETVFDTRIRFEASCALQSMNGYLAKQLECRRSIPKKKKHKEFKLVLFSCGRATTLLVCCIVYGLVYLKTKGWLCSGTASTCENPFVFCKTQLNH